jgi:hypothetical protein
VAAISLFVEFTVRGAGGQHAVLANVAAATDIEPASAGAVVRFTNDRQLVVDESPDVIARLLEGAGVRLAGRGAGRARDVGGARAGPAAGRGRGAGRG